MRLSVAEIRRIRSRSEPRFGRGGRFCGNAGAVVPNFSIANLFGMPAHVVPSSSGWQMALTAGSRDSAPLAVSRRRRTGRRSSRLGAAPLCSAQPIGSPPRRPAVPADVRALRDRPSSPATARQHRTGRAAGTVAAPGSLRPGSARPCGACPPCAAGRVTTGTGSGYS